MDVEKTGFRFNYEPLTIFSADQWRYGREPVLRSMPDGSLICWVYSGGPREPHNSNVVLITHSQDRGETWTPPELLFSHEARGVWGTEIFTEGSVPLGFVHTLDAASHYLELRTAITYTYDNGVTWTEPVAPHGVPANISVRQGIVLSDGTWVFPVYWQECNEGWNWDSSATRGSSATARSWPFCCGCIRSANEGSTFSLHGMSQAMASPSGSRISLRPPVDCSC